MGHKGEKKHITDLSWVTATSGNHSDIKEPAQVLKEIYPEKESMIPADKGYVGMANRTALEDAQATQMESCIKPPKTDLLPNRKRP